MAGGDMLSVSVSGALATQRALATTGHNIANANTEGYSRQRVEMNTRPPQLSSVGAIGSGVTVTDISRVYDKYVTEEVRNNSSLNEFYKANYEFTTQVDNMLADPNAGLAPALQSFFAAVNGVTDDPSDVSARQVMLSEANSLAKRFEFMDSRFNSLRNAVTEEVKNITTEISDISKAIAKLNDTIVKAREVGGKSPSDLLDQRDRLVQRLSELISVRVVEQDDTRLNVFMGNGQTLVVGSNAAALEVRSSRSDPDEFEVYYTSQGSQAIVTKFLTGGRIGGVMEFRKGVLNAAQNGLGRIAMALSKEFNEQHNLGMTLDNKLGGDFFLNVDKISPKVIPNASNQGTAILKAEITDIDQVTESDYELLYRSGQYRLIRMQDNKIVDTFNELPREFKNEGFSITITNDQKIQEGDSFVIRPTRNAAAAFRPLVKNVREIAAATPLRTQADIDNTGTGEISVGIAIDAKNKAFVEGQDLKPPFAVRFVDDKHFEILDNTGSPIKFKRAAVPDTLSVRDDVKNLNPDERNPNAATPAISAKEKGGGPATPAVPADRTKREDEEPIPQVTTLLEYDPINGSEVFPTPDGQDFGFRVKVSGQPDKGDVFRIEYNTDGFGDNTNIVQLAALQGKKVLSNGASDMGEAYSQLVARVGSHTHELHVNGKAQEKLLEQSVERRDSISGVNLDEEAAKLVKYQNLYQANAKVIGVANHLMEVLLNSFGR